MDNTQILTEGCEYFGISLDEGKQAQFLDYYRILVEWNSFMNLTAITDFKEVLQKHFVDSLALNRAMRVEELNSLIDVGTGAGFPGIPLKIAFPHLEVVLLDSLNKRVKFLNEVIEKLGLRGIRAVHGRAEDFARQKEFRERFDVSVSRAVANLSSLSEYCLPYTRVGGWFVPYKSGNIEEELKGAEKAIVTLGGRLERVEKFCLPESDIERSLVIISKMKKTEKKYPRKAGMPAKEPIL